MSQKFLLSSNLEVRPGNRTPGAAPFKRRVGARIGPKKPLNPFLRMMHDP